MTRQIGRPARIYIERNGRKFSVPEWAALNGVSTAMIYERIQSGCIDGAVCSGIGLECFSVRGHTHSLTEWAKITGVSIDTIRHRLRNGWSLEQAITTPTPALRRRGVVDNLADYVGTGGGSVAQDRAETEFSESSESSAP